MLLPLSLLTPIILAPEPNCAGGEDLLTVIGATRWKLKPHICLSILTVSNFSSGNRRGIKRRRRKVITRWDSNRDNIDYSPVLNHLSHNLLQVTTILQTKNSSHELIGLNVQIILNLNEVCRRDELGRAIDLVPERHLLVRDVPQPELAVKTSGQEKLKRARFSQ